MFILKAMVFILRMFVLALTPLLWLMGDRSNAAEDRKLRQEAADRRARQHWARAVAEAERQAASQRHAA